MKIEKMKIEQIKEKLTRNPKTKKVEATINNVILILENDPRFAGRIRFNRLTQRQELKDKCAGGRRAAEDITEMDELRIIRIIESEYGLQSNRKIREGIRVLADDNGYHPICDFLNSLKWDGTERIRYVLKHFLGAEVNEYTYECMKLFLLGAVNRVFDPGCKFEYMICLVGGQGAGKSTFVRFLAHNDAWFSDGIGRLDDEKIYEHLVGHWILEIAEMMALQNSKSNESAKAFLSRQSDNFRLPYGYRAEDRPRQSVYAGTSNLVQFLPNDRSGNRRFLPIQCDRDKAEVHILEHKKESREYCDQLWAEAMTIYRSGDYQLRLPEEMEKNLAAYQEPFMQEDTWADLIKTFLDDYTGDIVCSHMLYNEALDMGGKPNRKEIAEINEIMSGIPDWVRYDNPSKYENYKKQKGWMRVTASPEASSEKSF